MEGSALKTARASLEQLRSPLSREVARARLWAGAVWARYLLVALVAAYIVTFSWLSLLRHETQNTNALDLGYYDQPIWNTLRGRFFEVTLLKGMEYRFASQAVTQKTTSLLGFHVEPMVPLLSLLYLVFSDPRLLLVAQTVVLGLGALPAYWIARDRLQSKLAGVVFAALYLLSPSVNGANLSDFHPITLAATFLLFALHYALERRYGWFALFAFLAVSTREDVALPTAMMGLYLLVWQRARLWGTLTMLLSIGWLWLAVGYIIPSYNELGADPFASRYRGLGDDPASLAQNLVTNPLPFLERLARPPVQSYLVGLLSNAGFLSLFHLPVLLVALPSIALNALSSFPWQFSEGGHYSVTIVPFIIVSGILGLAFLSRHLPTLMGFAPRNVILCFSAGVLVSGGFHHYVVGSSPLAEGFEPYRRTPHQELLPEFVRLIPAEAAVSAQSALVPHLSQRQRLYLFPAINDAEYVLLDATSTPFPTDSPSVVDMVQKLLDQEEFGVLAAKDGFLLLKRRPTPTDGLAGRFNQETRDRSRAEFVAVKQSGRIPPEFYTFLRAQPQEIDRPLTVDFGGLFRLEGFSVREEQEVSVHSQRVVLRTYWRALQLLGTEYDIVVLYRDFREPGAPLRPFGALPSAPFWYATREWQRGELIRVRTRRVVLPRDAELYVTVVKRGLPWERRENRPAPLSSPAGKELPTSDGGTLLRLFNQRELASLRPRPPRELSPLPPLLGVATVASRIAPRVPTSSLTGERVSDPALLHRRPLAVAIDNARPARPQAGLSQADIVYEHLAEGGIGRFVAIFHTGDADPVGPVRSGRLVAIEVATQYKSLFAHFGASQPVMERFRQLLPFDLDFYWDRSLYYRTQTRPAPYNAYSSTTHLRERAQARGWEDAFELKRGFPFLPSVGATDDSNAPPASYVRIPMSFSNLVEYRYDPESRTYRRFLNGEPHIDALNEEQIRVTNVVVQHVRSWIPDIFNSPAERSHQFEMVGEGEATVFRDGLMFPGRWVRPHKDELTQFLEHGGRPIALRPGRTWITLVSPETKVTVEE